MDENSTSTWRLRASSPSPLHRYQVILLRRWRGSFGAINLCRMHARSVHSVDAEGDVAVDHGSLDSFMVYSPRLALGSTNQIVQSTIRYVALISLNALCHGQATVAVESRASR